MKKHYKKIYLLIILLLAVGFASVSAYLYINGDVSIGVNTDDYKVYFISATQDGLDKSNLLISSDKKTINYTITNLTSTNDKSTLVYEIRNDSSQYDANVKVNCTLSDNEYVSYTNSLENDVITAKSQVSGTLTLTLLKPTTEEMTVNLKCEIEATAVERDSEAEGSYTENPYVIAGYLTNVDGTPLTNANLVVYSNTPHYVTTDNYGYFAVSDLERGEHEIYYLTESLDEIKEMSKEEVIENKSSEGIANTNKNGSTITFDNNLKIADLYSSTDENESYSVELDADGGTLDSSSLEVTENNLYGDLPTPVRKGYEFIGWYLDDELITSTTYVVGKDITKLVAKYEPLKYNVTVTGSNATISESSLVIPYGSSETVTITPASGYRIVSMSCTNGYTTNFTTGTDATAIYNLKNPQTITITNNSDLSDSVCTFKTANNNYLAGKSLTSGYYVNSSGNLATGSECWYATGKISLPAGTYLFGGTQYSGGSPRAVVMNSSGTVTKVFSGGNQTFTLTSAGYFRTSIFSVYIYGGSSKVASDGTFTSIGWSGTSSTHYYYLIKIA